MPWVHHRPCPCAVALHLANGAPVGRQDAFHFLSLPSLPLSHIRIVGLRSPLSNEQLKMARADDPWVSHQAQSGDYLEWAVSLRAPMLLGERPRTVRELAIRHIVDTQEPELRVVRSTHSPHMDVGR